MQLAAAQTELSEGFSMGFVVKRIKIGATCAKTSIWANSLRMDGI